MPPGDETPSDAEGETTSQNGGDLRDEFEAFKSEIKERTVSRSDLESSLHPYIRRRIRRGHARGWGPYLVLLYGTVMTLGAFYFLSGGWAILAMIVIWLSTLGLYVVMLIVGAGVQVLSVPRQAVDTIRDRRE